MSEYIIIREAEPKDSENMLDVRKSASIGAYVGGAITEHDIEVNNDRNKAKMLENALTAGAWKGWVAENGAEMVGIICAEKRDAENRILLWYVRPELQGRGIGRQLWEKAMAYLGRDKDIILEVSAANAGQQRYYEKLGFMVERQSVWKLETGKTIPETVMRLAGID